MENTINLKGRNVLVTGGGRGIGAGISEKMAMCGANVMINYHRNKKEAKNLADMLRDKYGIFSSEYKADISDPDQVLAMFKELDHSFGTIDVLVNNAGCENIEHALFLDLQDWDKVMNVNVRGAFVCSQEAGKRMMNQDGGVIINISSIHDKVARKGLIHYCSSKAALNMMTKCLALELAEYHIRVVTVSPGAIETEMNRGEINKIGRENFNQWIPLGKVGEVDDVAWTCAFLASDKANYFTGTEIYIDGGYKESTIPYDVRSKKIKNS